MYIILGPNIKKEKENKNSRVGIKILFATEFMLFLEFVMLSEYEK